MVSSTLNQEASRIFCLDDKLDPNFEKPGIKPPKSDEIKISKFQMLKKKISDASSLIKTKVKFKKKMIFFLFSEQKYLKKI